ncbi:DUF3052 domain-containing protein [Paenibacillus hemerocallicola]|uniref:DUF3052 domain-containing protein n=1 Tax=Paenibacillus hemerocallicola TaxID=1172614 RepID=A0A5C4TGE1_9BACL|nr:DUF3052 domain-containing protein [Paenibacillus hemerocallicola]TNJ68121.1 DUF3052 domain-containing protein [Paenibacillus hemerocallicola]
MSAGYSGTPLIQKLGIKQGTKICIVNEPDPYWELLGTLPPFIEKADPNEEQMDFIHIFANSKSEIEKYLNTIKGHIKQTGMVWVSWPKKSSKIITDLNEDVIRKLALDNQLVDVKVCAVDETWSALKLVIPLKHRK